MFGNLLLDNLKKFSFLSLVFFKCKNFLVVFLIYKIFVL